MKLLLMKPRVTLSLIAEVLDLDYPSGMRESPARLKYLGAHGPPELKAVFTLAEEAFSDFLSHPITSKIDMRQLEAFLLGVLRTLEAQAGVS